MRHSAGCAFFFWLSAGESCCHGFSRARAPAAHTEIRENNYEHTRKVERRNAPDGRGVAGRRTRGQKENRAAALHPEYLRTAAGGVSETVADELAAIRGDAGSAEGYQHD